MDIFEQTELLALDCYDQLLALGHLEMPAVQSPTSRALERSMCNVCHLTQILSAHMSGISFTLALTSRRISSAAIQGVSDMTHLQAQERRREWQCMSV